MKKSAMNVWVWLTVAYCAVNALVTLGGLVMYVNSGAIVEATFCCAALQDVVRYAGLAGGIAFRATWVRPAFWVWVLLDAASLAYVYFDCGEVVASMVESLVFALAVAVLSRLPSVGKWLSAMGSRRCVRFYDRFALSS